ncbi:AsmA family protein [Myxococcus sp. K15C18031901]|uniref:AsmA family protein n=1 Tax=Myxococcus dinghuensis TaxID=2906761 RepID=UPI0020A75292|nr:AsmA-like C-terminal region-containing protein [Myxococcus dinghuensis]MCP3102868.1 AsmA family protein [Myxococcus dinghuensis]
MKVALAIVGAALVLTIAAMAIKPSWLGERLRAQVEAVATRSLGRKVTIEKLDAHLLPTPGATITNLRAEGAGSEPPFLQASRVTATVQLWPFLRSLGKDVRVGSVHLVEPTLNLVHHGDGSWNHETLERPPASPSGASGGDTAIEHLHIRDGVVRVMDQASEGRPAVVALQDIDADLNHVGPGHPLEGKVRMAVAAPKQNVELDLKVDSLPRSLPQAGQPWPQVTARLKSKDMSVSAFRRFLPASATEYFTAGALDVDADLKTDQGHYVLSGHGAAKGLRLRGDAANGSFAFDSRVDPHQPKTAKVSFTQIALSGPGLELGGTASAQLEPARVRFSLAGKELDLGHLLGAMPARSASEEARPPATPLISKRAGIGKVDMAGTLHLATLRHGALTVSDVDVQATLDDGALVLQRGTANVYGGRANITGSRVDFTKAQPEWSLRATLDGLDTAKAFQALTGHSSLQGAASGDLQLSGAGLDWERVRNQMTGTGTLRLRDGVYTSTDLGATVAPAVSQGLEALGKKATSESVRKAGQGTHFKDLDARFRIQGGWASFTQPMAFDSDLGKGTLDGRVSLDERLELKGTVQASQQFVSGLTHGTVPIKAPVSVPITITGTVKDPQVKAGSPTDIAQGLLPAVPVPKELEGPANQARKGLENLFQKRPREK